MEKTYSLHSMTDRREVVEDFFKQKERANYYAVTYNRYFFDGFGLEEIDFDFQKQFTDEQMELVKGLVATCIEEDINLDEAIGEDKEKYGFLQREPEDMASWIFIPQYVDLDTVYHRYRFKYGYHKDGLDQKPFFLDITVDLTDEEYKDLLYWRLSHPYAGFMSIRHDHPELFKKLTDFFDGLFYPLDDLPPFYSPTYFIETEEVDEDVKLMMEKYSIQK